MSNTETEISPVINRMLLNSIMTRMSGMGTTFSGKRDIYTALGYPGLEEIKFSDYYNKYRRQDIASRIIDIPVEETWKDNPFIEIPVEEETTFEKTWRQLTEDFGIYNTLSRFDRLIGLGKYAVLLIGVSDGLPLYEPVETTTAKLLYLQPYSESNATIESFDTDSQSPRFNLPKFYSLKISSGNQTENQRVHHSRIIHGLEFSLESSVYGFPRLERIYNRLLNLELVVGGSAEMFWQGAFPGMAFSPKDKFSLPTDAPGKKALEEEIEKYVHQLQRYMKLDGVDVEQLNTGPIASPLAAVDVQLRMISIASGIPKRILEGSERGELASTQDEKAWLSRIERRRINFVNPVILNPLINKLISFGILPEPPEYNINWPDLLVSSNREKAETGKIIAEAINKYTSDINASMYLTFDMFLEEILQLDTEVVQRIKDSIDNELDNITNDEQDDDELIDDL